MVATPSIFYTFYTVLFHKDGGANVAVTNCMSYFPIFVQTNATVKLANVNTLPLVSLSASLIYTFNIPFHVFLSFRPYVVLPGVAQPNDTIKIKKESYTPSTSQPPIHSNPSLPSSSSWRFSPYRKIYIFIILVISLSLTHHLLTFL